MILTEKQTIALDILEDRETEELLYGGAAGGAKSSLGCYWQLKRRMRMAGSRGFIGRAVAKTLKDTTLKTFIEVAAWQKLVRGNHFDLTGPWDIESPNCIEFKNGSLIFLRDLFLYPSDPDFDDLGSLEITDAFVDECSQVVQLAKDTLKIRIRYGLDRYCHVCGSQVKDKVLEVEPISNKVIKWVCDHGHITTGLIPKILYGTNPNKTWPYREFYRPAKDHSLPKYRKFIQAFIQDNPYAPASYVTSLHNMPEGPQKERLLRGNWEYDDDPAVLILYEKILDCFTNDFESLRGEKYLTVDVARFGKDTDKFGIWDGWRVKLITKKGLKVTETAEFARELQIEHEIPNSNTIVDEDGVGGGVVDILGCNGFVNNSTPVPSPVEPQRDMKNAVKPENYDNLKSQCSFKMAERINKNGIFIESHIEETKDRIVQEMEHVKQKAVDEDKKLGLLPKKDVKELIGRSPDNWDCIMMREWFELSPKLTWVAF